MRFLFLACLLACSFVARAVEPATFFFPAVNVLSCNGQTVTGPQPAKCEYGPDGRLKVSLDAWGREGLAVLVPGGAGPSIAGGFCAGSLKPDSNFPGAYQVNPECLRMDAPPVPASGEVLVDEWFSDLPWNQKLSTWLSNLINTPFVLPFAALPAAYRENDACAADPARCMLRYGIVNVVGIHRTDTLYKGDEALTPDDCQAGDCVEVKLDIHRFHTATDDPKGYAPEEIRNNPGQTQNPQPGNPPTSIATLGFAVTEATIFAPWRPWYMGHFCAVNTNIRDSVCYDDYFTTQLQAPPPAGKPWIKDGPGLFWPQGSEGIFTRFCKEGEDSCTLYLGKVDWVDADQPLVVDCNQPAGGEHEMTLAECQAHVDSRTHRLDNLFNWAITTYTDAARYPWKEFAVTDFSDQIRDNPFIGYYELERFDFECNSERGNQVPGCKDPPRGPGKISTPPDGAGVKEPPYLYGFRSALYALPKRCTKSDFFAARRAESGVTERLEECAVNFEIHTNGFYESWKDLYGETLPLSQSTIDDITRAMPNTTANQYGRTMFLFAGTPEQRIAVSFEPRAEITNADGEQLVEAMSLYDKVYNASKYTQYLPMVNPADRSLVNRDNPSDTGKSYADDFWHAFFMSNHMNQEPGHFIRGIRGRTLWHNEYRSGWMYDAATKPAPGGGRTVDGTKFEDVLEHVDFPAGFQTKKPNLAPFHGNTCDSCHIRNGSGLPLMPNGQLPKIHTDRAMKANYQVNRDYTYSNPELPPMKMVLFDLEGGSGSRESCADDKHTVPKTAPWASLQPARRGGGGLYRNKIMNFYGNSFHLNQNDEQLIYNLEYQEICPERNDGYEVVDQTPRKPIDHNGGSSCKGVDGKWSRYQPMRVQVDLNGIKQEDTCTGIAPPPEDLAESGLTDDVWPTSCADVSGSAITQAIEGGEIGFMHLMGRRLGNTPMIEMVPEQVILQSQYAQQLDPDITSPGCVSLAPGTRAGAQDGRWTYNYRSCKSGHRGEDSTDCYIGRWGWIGDRASLEDQVANAAHVEMNITSTEGVAAIHPLSDDGRQWVRYENRLCGPANLACQTLPARADGGVGNSDLTEEEIRNMATYQRWIGIPNRSEYQVANEAVREGEKIFHDLKCNSCHVVRKIGFIRDDNMLPDEEREHLARLEIRSPDESAVANTGSDGVQHSRRPGDGVDMDTSKEADYPFISYLGTDLLLHDMGYLSQVAPAPDGVEIRDKDGRVKLGYGRYVQKIRTPALKGLRFNRFVTDSNHNLDESHPNLEPTEPPKNMIRSGCDFLLHDGRACDAIEAAYLHDGPTVKSLGMIEKLNKLTEDQLRQLRAFLYSL
jgi:hypothetical protein